MPRYKNAGRIQSPTATAGARYPFTVHSEKAQQETVLFAVNDGPAPIYLTVELTARDNLATDVEWPLACSIPPCSRVCLARLSADSPAQRYGYEYFYRWSVGPARSVHARGVIYAPPFPAGLAFPFTQAAGGHRTTHDTPDSWHAVDLGMPVGTPILAARGGLVFETRDGFGEGRPEPAWTDRANLVRVLHDDGTIAEYVHLRADSLAVRPGQRVVTGDLLGLSGNSGYSTGPHLHFGVQRKQGHQFLSVPVRFAVRGRPLLPRAGQRLEAT